MKRWEREAGDSPCPVFVLFAWLVALACLFASPKDHRNLFAEEPTASRSVYEPPPRWLTVTLTAPLDPNAPLPASPPAPPTPAQRISPPPENPDLGAPAPNSPMLTPNRPSPPSGIPE